MAGVSENSRFTYPPVVLAKGDSLSSRFDAHLPGDGRRHFKSDECV